MKLTKLAKNLLAVSALTVTSFGANASVIAEASIDVTALSITIFDENKDILLPAPNPGGFGLNDVAVSFNGTSVSTTLNGNTDGDSFATIISDPFLPLAVDLNSNQSNSASNADAHSGIFGNIFAPGGANGSTSGKVGVYGSDSGDSNSQIINNLEASFTFGVTNDGFAKIDFTWFLDTYVSVFDEGGEGVADWGLSIVLKDDSCTGFSCTPLYEFNLNNLPSQTGTLNSVGDMWDEEAGGTVQTDFLALTGGTKYVFQVAQSSNAAALSVPEPTSIAIFGLGLLGLAGAARRRQS
jgi:hypothetical protein